MQVPAVAAQVLEWVSVQEPDVQTLMHQIQTINVFKVYPTEARVPSTWATKGEWWVWGVPAKEVLRTSLTQLITEAQQFFPQHTVSQFSCCNIWLIKILGSLGSMAFLLYLMSGQLRELGSKISNSKWTIC